MTILVTGATGFLGRRVVQTLLDRGKQVRCLIHTPGREVVLNQRNVDIHYGSVTNRKALMAASYDIESVIHLVGVIRETENSTFDRINVQGMRNMVSVARARGIGKFVHVSAMGAQDNPALPYLHSKWRGERVLMDSGIPYLILRPSVQFGEGDEFINTLAAMIKAFPVTPLIGMGRNEFQPIAVGNVAQCIARAVTGDFLVNKIVEIGGPERLTYTQISDIVGKAMGVRRAKLYLPIPLVKLVVKLMEAILPRSPVTIEQIKMMTIPNYTDLNTVQQLFDFKPSSLQGSIDFVNRVGMKDALKIAFGFMPPRIRDH